MTSKLSCNKTINLFGSDGKLLNIKNKSNVFDLDSNLTHAYLNQGDRWKKPQIRVSVK